MNFGSIHIHSISIPFLEQRMIITILLWGAVAGLVHFVLIGILYGNPITERISAKAEAESPAVRKWPSKVKYFVTQFFGTRVEVYILTFAFVWLRPLVGINGYVGRCFWDSCSRRSVFIPDSGTCGSRLPTHSGYYSLRWSTAQSEH
jgi:hypothetical protein